MMSKIIPFLVLASTGVAWAQSVEIDGVAAKVGSETILKSEVVNEMRRMGLPDPSRYEEVRNEMIERKLILKAASESKMTMQEWVVENRVREIIQKAFDGDRNKLIEALGRQQISYPEWLARMKEDMIVGAMRWNVVDKNVTASPAAMKKEYAEHPERYAENRKVTISVILLKPEEKSRRVEISMQLKTKSFEELGAKRYADIVKPEDLFNEIICKEIAAMPKGTMSHWLEIDGWSYLLKKDDESAGRQLSFSEAFEQIEANVKEAAAKEIYSAWLERLKAETYIKIY